VSAIYQDPEPKPESQDALAKIEKGSDIQVIDQPSLVVANAILHLIKDYEKGVEAEFSPGIQQALEHHRFLVAQKKKWLDRAVTVRDQLKRKIAAFLEDEDRKRLAAQRASSQAELKARIEADRAADRVHELITKGELDEADKVASEGLAKVQQHLQAAPVVPEKVVAEGSNLREDWDFEVIDFTIVPDKYKILNDTLVRGIVKKLHDQAEIPGIRPVSKKVLVVRGGRS
jgi:hypothetical protein